MTETFGSAPNLSNPIVEAEPARTALARAVGLLLLVALADLLLWDGGGGTGAALLFAAAGVAVAARSPEAFRAPGRALLLAALGALSLRCVWEARPLALFLLYVTLPAVALAAAAPAARALEIAAAVPFALAGGGWSAVERLRAVSPVLRAFAGTMRRPGPGRVAAIVGPIVLVGVFGAVFVAANPVIDVWFGKALEWAAHLLDYLSLNLPRTLFWGFWLWTFAGILWPIGAEALRRIGAAGEEVTASEKTDEPLYPAARNALVAVNLLFLVYNLLDAVYLWWHAALPEGISFSAYAHRGVTWLTFALFLSTAAIGAILADPIRRDRRVGRLVALSLVWAAQNGVLAVGALRRIHLYMEYNGLTYLRLVGITGVLLVAVGLGLMVWKIVRGKTFLWLVRRDALAFYVAGILFALAPVDGIVAVWNVRRLDGANLRPLAWLARDGLGREGLVAVFPLLDHPDPTVRIGAAAEALRLAEDLGGETDRRAWSGARAFALARVEAERSRIEAVLGPYDRDEACLALYALSRKQW